MAANNSTSFGQFGDTTLTKVFVGGLAWETPKETLREHFHKYGHILEAVIISDKISGRSKGYGFVTFKEPEEAKKACEDAMPLINGRRANCNLASLGARRPRSSPPPTPTQHGSNIGARSTSTTPPLPPTNQVQWYYPATPPPVYHQRQYPYQTVPNYYGYPPTYIASDVSYNHKLGYTGGAYVNGQVYGGQAVVPMYPIYQTHAMGLPAAHMYSPPGPLVSKPTCFLPKANSVCLAVE